MAVQAKVSRRHLLLTGAGALAFTSGALAATAAAAMPNIVYIMADDMGYADVSCYGRPDFATPNIDRIAAGGVRLLQAYANSAVCSATRTALITGRYQYRLPIGLEEPLPSASDRNVGIPPDRLSAVDPQIRRIRHDADRKWHLGRLPDFGPLK